MKRIIVTVGPSLLYRIPLTEIHKDEYIYRINGAHGDMNEIEKHILVIKEQIPDAVILLDLPGNKVRTANLNVPIKFQNGKEFSILSRQINYQGFYKYVQKGDTVWANDSVFRFTIQQADEEQIVLLAEIDGELHNNKGLHVRGIHDDVPFLFDKDYRLIELANKYKIDFIGLSFVRNVEDLQLAREYINIEVEIIAKVETKSSVVNIQSILNNVEYILLDRGDLSTEIGIEKIPDYQKFIIDKTLFHNKRIFLATQFLKNMEETPVPTIAEVIDMYNTLKSGVYGIQLAEETAVGKYPKECLNLIDRLIKEVDNERR
jgi:pyruvate kinase